MTETQSLKSPIPPSPEVLTKLKEADWADLIDRMVKYAQYLVGVRYFWKGEWGGPPPGGAEAMDVVQSAIAKTFSGERRWNPEKSPNLAQWLIQQVRSVASNAYRSPENRQEVSERVVSEKVFVTVDDDTPENLFFENLSEAESEEFVSGFYYFIAGEKPLTKVLDLLLDGIKRSEIAVKLSISRAEFDAIKKQLKRRLAEYIESTKKPK